MNGRGDLCELTHKVPLFVVLSDKYGGYWDGARETPGSDEKKME